MADKHISEGHSLLESSFPVLLPSLGDVLQRQASRLAEDATPLAIDKLRLRSETPDADSDVAQEIEGEAFMKAMLSHKPNPEEAILTLTDNDDGTYEDSGEVLVDLFHDLDQSVSAARLEQLLPKAWAKDSVATLRIIWNARSIHLGKSDRMGFYRAIAWVADHHPATFLSNLPWLVRPIIRKAVPKTDGTANADDSELVQHPEADEDDDFELIDPHTADSSKRRRIEESAELAQFDIKYGHAHGYWKDLLNLLTLAARGQLHVDGKIEETFRKPRVAEKPRLRDWTPGQKRKRVNEHHADVVKLLRKNKFYREFHATVAQLFTDQLRTDLARLQSGSEAALKRISVAAKWAPSNKGSHDSQTFIVTTIAGLLHPDILGGESDTSADHALKVKKARVAYQSKTLAPLRKHLDIVERHLTDKSYDKIEYSHIPSLAMSRYSKLFMRRDFEHFDDYLTDVAEGKARISGAILMPSTLVATALSFSLSAWGSNSYVTTRNAVERQVMARMIDGQWKSLVQRIKDSGTLESAIAVCDVSGSMCSPMFKDRTNPMHSAIGLSLLVAEVTKPPFGGAFITFSANPAIVKVGGELDDEDEESLTEKCEAMMKTDWEMNTNFVAVFEDLILPMAIKHKVKQEDMVKRIFVFSDMQFDAAEPHGNRWSTSYERIKRKYADAGYEMPELVFWNLAGGSTGPRGGVSKPVHANEPGTSLVSGYSQAMLKVFLDGGSFDEGVDDDDTVVVGEDGKEVFRQARREGTDPLKTMYKAIGHEAYRMLKVVD